MARTRCPRVRLRVVFALFVVSALAAADGTKRTRADYQYFRALAIDLLGRPPTRAEIAETERPGFDVNQWIDAHLTGPSYAARLRRIYIDLLRLELAPTFRYEPAALALRRVVMQGPSGPVAVYFRLNQRRMQPDLDGEFCFTEDETGVRVGGDGSVVGTPRPVSQALLDQRTKLVRPWWLYADYRAADPRDRASPEWASRFPGYELALAAFTNPDGSPTTDVRVCKEEAQTKASGHVVATGRIVSKATPIPKGRTRRPPGDSPFAKANAGKAVSCLTQIGFESSPECGCGVGLERCMPVAPAGFVVPVLAPLGDNEPFSAGPQPASLWSQHWWSEEAVHFLDDLFMRDRDIREMLTSRGTVINGPLAQFYRFFTGARCCGTAVNLGYSEPEPLFDPRAVPAQLTPEDTSTWTRVEDRGPHAAGLLTMPVFLIKYGTRRARAHSVYSTFLCKDFVAPTVKLTPSDEHDLMRRRGCSSCHMTLEPLAAYFTRVLESDWTYLPADKFPMSSSRCTTGDPQHMPGTCRPFYDPDFTNANETYLRGGYASPAHAESGPHELAVQITRSPEFAQCVAKNLAQSFLGRPLSPDEAVWNDALAKTLIDHDYRVKELVRAILTSEQYKASTAGGGPR